MNNYPNTVVVVVAYERPEMLNVCLEYVEKAEHSRENKYLFALDSGYNPENKTVISSWVRKTGVTAKTTVQTIVGGSPNTKQSRNVLEGYRKALELFSPQRVILLEEDIIVAKDFFDWHAKVHQQDGNFFCSIATKNHNSPVPFEENPETYYVSYKADYQSLGVCWEPKFLERVLLHATPAYYQKPRHYLDTAFPNSVYRNSVYTEQDGLIRRVVEAQWLPVAFPTLPRAFHAGYYGYHRPSSNVPVGSLADRTGVLKEIIFDKERMKELSGHLYYDSIPLDNMETETPKTLVKVGHIGTKRIRT